MSIRSNRNIYQLLEKHLRAAEAPMTCVELMAIDEIRKEAMSEFGGDIQFATNKLSDCIGLMWRKELLKRYPAIVTGGSQAKYAYIWGKTDSDATPEPLASPPPRRTKTGVLIKEHDDGVIIEFEKFTVFVKPK
jgi:hypothetical protein